MQDFPREETRTGKNFSKIYLNKQKSLPKQDLTKDMKWNDLQTKPLVD